MAQDYVKELSLNAATGGPAERASVRRSPEQEAAREASARQADAENGRYGRFVDQQGNWATAWQAPGPRTPVVPPAFVGPTSRVFRMGTNELVIQAGNADPLRINPGDWVVVYDTDRDAPLVAEDEQFRKVMTIKEDYDRAAAERRAIEQLPEDGGDIMQKAPAHQQPTGAGGASQTFHTSVSIDGFVQQVLVDNTRLRQDVELLRVNVAELREQSLRLREDRDGWRGHAEQLNTRLQARLDEVEHLRAQLDRPEEGNGADHAAEQPEEAVDATPNAAPTAPATPDEPPALDAQRGHARVNQPPRNKVTMPKGN